VPRIPLPIDRAVLFPGKPVEDLLAFEVPPETIKYLNVVESDREKLDRHIQRLYLELELPAENFGGDGTLKLHIPGVMLWRALTEAGVLQ
jgi:hypothetical protein